MKKRIQSENLIEAHGGIRYLGTSDIRYCGFSDTEITYVTILDDTILVWGSWIGSIRIGVFGDIRSIPSEGGDSTYFRYSAIVDIRGH